MTTPVPAETPDEDPLREQLLDAAARVFAAKGYAGTKIMDIVRAAGLSSGAVYGRFDSKDELLMEAVLRRVDEHAVGLRFQGRTVGEIVMDTSRTDGALDDVDHPGAEVALLGEHLRGGVEELGSQRIVVGRLGGDRLVHRRRT